MEIKSISHALEVLEDVQMGEMDREDTVHYLENHPTQRSIQALVENLDDDDFGVRWAIAAALAGIGAPAFPTLLEELIRKAGESRFRESVYHVLHYSRDADPYREQVVELMKALKGPAADLVVPRVAYAFLNALESQGA